MPMNRREFLTVSGSVAAGLMLPNPVRAEAATGIKAVAFDGFTVFDPRPIAVLAESLFPGQGQALAQTWRTRQFEYTWLRTLMGNYADFWQVTAEALDFAVRQHHLDVSGEKRDRLLQSFLRLEPWPDAKEALLQMKAAGLRLAFLSNFTAAMLDACVKHAGLEGIFEAHLSTDRVRAFKPDPRAYQMGVDAFELPRAQIAFAAFGGWDAAGAKAFGYPTFWVNRVQAPLENLGAAADATGITLHELAVFVKHSA
ncbi:haloacid dehalogenase type II [Methylomonas sp. EFPC3]|uniref:haloacid dehalogenase type II n=1 Tax=Methylomonas sp. EFPC3 TaxID=3021710 RepID=UPI0024176C06|nr:haloacid dehalogenase type II [Methylomonas sp. EFPC3]WFP50307.1 haloacid dehalogenase type II [Methylomonas sp. EFPC3]